MQSRGIRKGLVGVAILIGVALLLVALRPRLWPAKPAAAVLPPTGPASPAAPAQAPAAPAEPPEERSHLADALNARDGSVQADLRIIDGIFKIYRSALRDGDPVGENAEITAALSGRNKLGLAFIPRDNPAINAKGQLCDRWGTPYFFHQLSGTAMEIRSAGPDHRLWTADDVVFTP